MGRHPEVDTDLLQQVLAGMAALEARVAVLESSRSTLSRSDLRALAQIFPAAVGALGSELCLAKELCQHPAPGLRLVLADWSAKRLGKLLDRSTGIPVNGLMVQREGEENGAALWRIVAVFSDFDTSGNPDAPAAAARVRASLP